MQSLAVKFENLPKKVKKIYFNYHVCPKQGLLVGDQAGLFMTYFYKCFFVYELYTIKNCMYICITFQKTSDDFTTKGQ